MKNRLGELVRAARGDISLRDYAKQIGISHSYLSSIESGINPANGKPISIGLETLEKLSKVTGYSVAYLTGDNEEGKPATRTGDELSKTKYEQLNAENRAAIDALIDRLLASQSGE